MEIVVGILAITGFAVVWWYLSVRENTKNKQHIANFLEDELSEAKYSFGHTWAFAPDFYDEKGRKLKVIVKSPYEPVEFILEDEK